MAYAAKQIQSLPLSQFQDSIGVNTHVEYGDGQYANIGLVVSSMTQMGIRHARNSAPDPSFWASCGIPGLKALTIAGIKLDLVCQPGLSPADNIAQIKALGVLDSIAAIEGFNEWNNQKNMTEAIGETFQGTLYSLVKADPDLKNKPVIDAVSGLAVHDLSKLKDADFPNGHPYPSGGKPPAADVVKVFTDNYIGSKSGYITEGGYQTRADGGNGVNQMAQAAYLFDFWLDAVASGCPRFYAYELLDGYPPGSPGYATLGLVNYSDQSFKVSGLWFKNLHAVIPFDAPSTAVPVSVTLAALNGGQLAGFPASVKQLALTGSDGSVYLWTWDEQPLYDETKQASIPCTLHQFGVTLDQPGNYAVSSFSPEQGFAQPLAAVTNYQGHPAYISYYTQFPTCTIFRKQ